MKNKRENGITLIALVITIIILLILAGIAISQLTNSGLFENSKLAKEKHENAQLLEDSILKQYENAINNGDIASNRDTVTIPKAEYDILKNAHSYSTTEKVVGTWTNGKPLYQKTVSIGTQSTANQSIDKSFETDLNISNIDKSWVIMAYGYYNSSGNSWVCHSFPTDSAYLFICGEKICFRSSGNAYTYKDIVATIQYTKTTD